MPSLADGGGIPSVASFLWQVLDASDRYEPFLVSLAMASNDASSVRLLDPRSWIAGVRVLPGTWEGRPYLHVGARLSEIEFMRYARRQQLTEVLEGADLVHVVAGTPCWALATTGVRMPVLLLVASLAARERERRHQVEKGLVAHWRRAMTRVTERLDRAGLRRAERVFVLNSGMLRQTQQMVGPARVLLAPPGVDVDRFRPRDSTEPEPSESYILSVARFGDPRKNVDLLFHAYGMLRERQKAAPKLWLAGPSAPPASAWSIADAQGVKEHIRYLGPVSEEELPRLYRNALLFVLSSDEEGFGLVLLEAMGSAVPVVSTNCGGPGDIISHGEDGLLTPTGDREALADAMEKLLTSPERRIQMGRRGREKTEGQFSLEAAGDRILSEYDRLLAVGEAQPG